MMAELMHVQFDQIERRISILEICREVAASIAASSIRHSDRIERFSDPWEVLHRFLLVRAQNKSLVVALALVIACNIQQSFARLASQLLTVLEG